MQYHNTSMLNQKELKDLKKRLPRGYFKRVCEKVSWGDRKVSLFFEGHSYETDIHQAAIEVAEEYETKIQELIKRQKGKKWETPSS